MFERSEFGRRPLIGEERRGPASRSGAGLRQERMVLVTFAETKVTRSLASGSFALCDVALRSDGKRIKINGNSFRPEGRVTFVLAKVTKTVRS